MHLMSSYHSAQINVVINYVDEMQFKELSLSQIPFVLLLGVMKTIILVSWRNLGEDINDPPAETNHVYSQSVGQSLASKTINISCKQYTITIARYLQYYPRRNNQSSSIIFWLWLGALEMSVSDQIFIFLYISFLPLFDTITILWTI